ncbi:heptosyltransferase I, partial [Listeria marthii FSL S4-120]
MFRLNRSKLSIFPSKPSFRYSLEPQDSRIINSGLWLIIIGSTWPLIALISCK